MLLVSRNAGDVWHSVWLSRGSRVTRTTVRNLGQVRDLLAEWDRVRSGIVAGRVCAFHVTLCDGDSETIYIGGAYKDDPERALRAVLRVSAARMLAEDDPLPRSKLRAT